MVPPPECSGQGQSQACGRRVPPGSLGNNAVNWPISSSSTHSGEPCASAIGKSPISLQTKGSQPPAELQKIDVPGIAHLPPFPEISYDEYDADDQCNRLLDLGSVDGKSPISLTKTQISLQEFAKRMGQANYSPFNQWQKVWVAGSLEKKQLFIMQGQNPSEKHQDGPLHWARANADHLVLLENWPP